jgi:DNA-binding NtrC family response regulator
VWRDVEMYLNNKHDLIVIQRASEAIALFERGETFDVVFSDLVMPDVSGPELYATVAERWPHQAERMVFMTGGAFTPQTIEFVEHSSVPMLSKPCSAADMDALVRSRMEGKA